MGCCNTNIANPIQVASIRSTNACFYPRLADGKRKKFNVYAKTREECEKLLAEMIAEKKSEIAAEKANTKTA